MKSHYQVAVIGAGPAGMAGATLAARHGASTLLLDEQARPGGQIYRGVETQSLSDRQILGADYYAGSALTERLRTSNVDYVPEASVWQISPEREIGVTVDSQTHLLTADQVIIATGAQERPFPAPGWTLPGVLNAGAAQILLKTSGVTLPSPVFVGCGPLLYLVAYQYLRAGVPVAGILNTAPRANVGRALRNLPAALPRFAELWKGWGWLRTLRKSGVPFVNAVEAVKFNGTDRLEAIEYRTEGQWKRIATKVALVHHGVVPNTNLAMVARCRHDWDETQCTWHAVTDAWCHSDQDGIAIAGDGARINGAEVAAATGQLAALGALNRLSLLDGEARDRLARPFQLTVKRQAGLRRFLDVLYQPAKEFRVPVDPTVLVCRCEEVTAGEVKDAVALGCQGPNQLKSFTRAGMGPCQSRFCGLTVCEMIAEQRGCPVSEVGPARFRPPVKPLELGQLAMLAEQD